MVGDFEFRYKNTRKGCHRVTDVRVVSFDMKQLESYSDIAKAFFIHCMVEQLRAHNGCDVHFEELLQDKVNGLFKAVDAYVPMDRTTMYLKNMMLDWFSKSVNCSFIDGWRSMLEVFELFKQTMDVRHLAKSGMT